MTPRALGVAAAAAIGFGLMFLARPAAAAPIIQFIEGPNDGDPFTIVTSGWDFAATNVLSPDSAFVGAFLSRAYNDPPTGPASWGAAIIDDPVTRNVVDWVGMRATPQLAVGSDPTSPFFGQTFTRWYFEFLFYSDASAALLGVLPASYPAVVANGDLQSMTASVFNLGGTVDWSVFGIELSIQSERPVRPVTVPEPATLLLLGIGAAALATSRRRRLAALTP